MEKSARALFLLAGVIMFVMAYVSHVFVLDLWITKTKPFTIFTYPFILFGAMISCYGLVAGRKIKGGKK